MVGINSIKKKRSNKSLKKEMVRCPVCRKKVETVICSGVQKYFDENEAYHECYRKEVR